MFVVPRMLLRSSLAALALIAGLGYFARPAQAQVTYVGVFAMVNAASDKALSDPGNSHMDHVDMRQYDWEAVPAQEWAVFLLPNGFFALMNMESGLFLEDPYATQSVTQVDQNEWTGGLHQQWFLCQMSGDFYAMVNASSGLILTDPYAGQKEGGFLSQEGWYDGLEQWWYFAFLYR